MASGPSGTPFALALILCCCLAGTSGQGFAPTDVGGQADRRVPFHLHFVEMMFDDKGSDLMDKTTQAYMDVENAIEIALQGLGGYLSELSFENGLPCVRANVVWANLIEDRAHEVKEKVDMSGIKLWNKAWKVSFEGCEAEMEAVVFNLYLPTLQWTKAMEDEKSSRYMSIKEEIETRFADLSGQLETLELSDNNGCLHVHVKWMAWFPAHIVRLTSDLKRTGLKLGDEVFIVETVPCMPSDAASRECPPVPPNTFGICIQDCDDNNPEMACDEGYKCCSNGCGNVCKKVNYKVVVTALIIIDEEFEEGMTQGYAMEVAQVGVDSAVKNLFNTPTATVVTSAKLRTFVEKDRWGRGYTMMVVDLYLSSDIPNDQLSSSLHAVEGTNLALGEANLRLLDASFSNHSMMDMQSCGGSMCHGICKHLITGEDYCSCDEGFEGPACSAFDCRQDVSQFASDAQANYCEQGQCVKADEGDSYECDCNDGYHGTLCNVNVCDMMDNPCGGHGTCVGLVEQGLLCRCESGWGGIFCDFNTTADDGMSTCEMERRLMQFVHQQIFSPNVSPQLRVFMSTLLKRMDSDQYSVPYCWAKGSGRDGEYHSTCVYSSTTGEWDECYCLSSTREFNGYMYFGEGDCRVFTADDIRWGHDYFFILNMTWSKDLVTFDSELYMSIKDQVSKTAEYLGGGLTHLEFFRTEDVCVKAVARWHLGSEAREGMLAEKLEGGGINVGVQNMKVSHQGCQDHGGDLHVVTYKFYVAGLPTPRDVTDHKGQVYRMAEAAVKQVFSGLGGKLRTLELAENNGCVMFFVEWEAAYPSKALSVLDELKESGLATDDMKTYTVQSRPCLPSDSQLEGCPGVPQDVFGTCDEACNTTDPCEKPGYKCCSNGCGKACVRVGYKVKVSAVIMVDMAVHEDMKNSSSTLYKSIEFGIDMMIKEVYNLGPTRAIVGTEITQILPMDYKSKTYPAIHVKIFLAEDFPNAMLLDSAYLLERSNLANLQNAPDFLMMKLLSHSTTDMTSCGGVECHGICKTLFSGDEYCSCEPGQRGLGCSVFDCRKDLDEYFPQDDFCHEGKCSLESESEGFQCDCNPGYYGDRCDVNVCKMTVEPCSYRGYCLGRVEEGMLCQCDKGRGGIFCDEVTTADETMTTCEKERRLMLYVHEQVKGQKPRSPRFATFISVILDRMKTPYYPVPFCWPEDPGSPLSREYHSICYYDSGTGAQMFCQCVHTDKTPNNLIHYAEGDCREQTGQSHTSIDTFYVYASTNDTSSIESGVREQVTRLIRPLFGRVDYIRVDSVIDGCVVVAVAWTVQTKVDWPLVDKLMESGIDVKGENLEVSSEMCKVEVDLDTCPLFMVSEISEGVSCPPTCSMDSDCDEDSKCCQGSCGDNTCTEVGFLDKISVDITVDMAWDPQLSSTSSITYIVTKSAIESGLNQEFMRRAVPGFKSSKVLAFYQVEREMEPVERKRRQVEAHLGITIEMKFTEELPVESLLQIQSDLLENGLQVMTNTYVLLEVKFAGMGQGLTDKDPSCGFYICSTGSLCGEKVGGIKYCACPKGWSGQSCDMMDCMSKGMSLCENGGSCVSYESGVNQCVCQVGYFGALCQERLCDYLNEDACGAGKCLGNLTSLDICKCPVGTGGLFCELQTADPRMTMCQKVKRFMDFFVPVWQGLEKDDKIKSVDKFAEILSHGGQLAVPKCWSDDSAQGGDYHSRCLYDMNTKKVDRCICTDTMGQPNYWEYDYESGQCRVYSQDCEGVICHNGGSCVGMPGGRSYCNCPDGFYGLGCENGAEDKCPEGRKPLMTDEGELQCRMFPCPYGFMCNGHPADKWTACCFDEEFLCKENPCQAGGTCHGNILNGDLCDCPPDRGGLLCEKSMPDEDLTHCQKHQRFLDMIISILKGGTSPVSNLTVENLRRILIHNEMEWIPENSCDDQGMYKTMTQAVNVLNPAGKIMELCIGLSGIPDPTCGAATCEMLSTNGMPELCKNGGRCLGDVRHMLCDCTGTGYHGFLCQIPGVAPKNETACTLGRDIANYALEVLFDPEQPDEVKDQLNKIISFHGSEDAGIFVPTCDAMGRFEYSGCEHPRALGKMVTCYCATMNGEMFGEEIRLMQPPDNCDGMKPDDGDKDECPEEWGKECIKPAWWCSKMFQCKKHERCSQVASLSGEKFECVPKETVLPCDFRPCKDNPYAMCSICGLHGVCYNMMMGEKNYNMDKPGEDDDDDDDDDGSDDDDDDDDADDDDGNDDKGKDRSRSSSTASSASGGMQSRPKPESGSKGSTSPAMDYTCSCSVGYSGHHCDVNDEVCSTVPQFLCPHGCLGDIDQGYLCKCPEGMAGMFCNKPVRSECERKKALYDDALEIMTDKMMLEGYDMDQLKTLIGMLVRMQGGDAIPRLNCTNLGLYAPVQCDYNMEYKTEYCYCANQKGQYMSSNIEPYIGFDICTANGDPRELLLYCSENLLSNSLCLNGGSCLFDVYHGHMCMCPDGVSGTFCEVEKPSSGEDPKSLCHFMANAYDSLRYLHSGMVQITETQMEVMWNVSSGFLFPYKNNQYLIKPECNAEGNFDSSAICYYDPQTDQKGDCFCWGPMGPDMHRPVGPGDDPDIKCSSPMRCPNTIKEKCPELKCAGGYRTGMGGCPVCECQHPCEHVKCKEGERCQVNAKECHKKMSNVAATKEMHDKDDMMENMEKCAMCVPVHKPGVCPDHNVAMFSSIMGGGLGFRSVAGGNMDEEANDDEDKDEDDNDSAMKNQCPETCRDDADCPGKMKCCGLCGSKCGEPLETSTCSEEAAKMNEYANFLEELERTLTSSQQDEANELSSEQVAMLERVTSRPVVWIPKCEEDGYLFKPLQCEYELAGLSNSLSPSPVHCFCVDRLGMRLHGSENVDVNDPNACVSKPGVCPYLTHGQEDMDNAVSSCTSDVDCLGKDKCCSDGVRHLCAQPVAKHMMATTDRLMNSLCKINPSLCNGICSDLEGMMSWDTTGQACMCTQRNKYGPFCQQTVSGDMPAFDTACRMKHVARTVFERNFAMAETRPEGIVLLHQDYVKQMYEMMEDYDWQEEGITMVKVECTPDGNFEPMQCVRDVLTWTDIACYCVDHNGTELIGTRMDIKDGKPNCGGEDQQMCPVGYPLHGADGNMLKCGANVDRCPKGYECTRGAYGQQHCCLTRKGMQNVCHLPADVGMDCPRDMRRGRPGTQYYFNGMECIEFMFKGCGGNKNRFSTISDCEARCKDNVHKGSCPNTPFQVNVGSEGSRCKNHCSDDKDCETTHKCCQSSCGRHCFPALDMSADVGTCPYGQPQGTCTSVKPCPDGHMCKMDGNEEGVCCIDHNSVNFCALPPQSNSNCFGLIPRYFYNASSMACEKFMYSGCDPEFNNFDSLEECCGACNGEGRCKEGQCPAVRTGTAISCEDECSADAMCSGKKICCSNGCAHVCVVPEVELPTDCFQRREAARKRQNIATSSQDNSCKPVDIPECTADGYWASEQCHKAFGLCWCVTPMGHFVSDTMTHGPASCDSLTEFDIVRADQLKVDPATVELDVCPNGEKAYCCPQYLCDKPCGAYPKATCRINPCGGCSAEYMFDGRKVNCKEGLSQCEAEQKQAAAVVQERHITMQMMTDRNGDNDMDDDWYDDDMMDDEYSVDTNTYQRLRVILPNIPLDCQLAPMTGPCRGYFPKWFYNPKMGTCDMFVWGMCQGNKNRFDSPAECYNTCNKAVDPCMNISCPAGEMCHHEFDKDCHKSKHKCEVKAVCKVPVSPNHATGIYMPRCMSDGDYSHKQCHDRYCWCVDEMGHYLDGLTTRGSELTCTANGMTSDSVIEIEECFGGKKPNITCVKACTKPVCPGNPEALCKVDLCSDGCAVKFVAEEGAEVDCQGNKCEVFTFDDEESKEECAVELDCNGDAVQFCPESVCQSAQNTCAKNPCAVCNVDPCTCQPYFVDAITGRRLSQDECAFISLGVCEAQTCNVLNARAAARLKGLTSNDTSLILPECDQKGRFKPKQCQGQMCMCVDEFGKSVGEPSDGSCEEIDEVVWVGATLIYGGSLRDLRGQDKVQSFKNSILEKLAESGINPAYVKIGDPYEGSIKVDVEIIQSLDEPTGKVALASNALRQAIESGDLDIVVDGQSFALDPEETIVTPQTASQVAQEVTTTTDGTTSSTPASTPAPADDDDDSGLSDTEKIIIGSVCGAVGLLILIIICYCVCCRKRKKETPPDDTYDHVRVQTQEKKDTTYDKPAALYNPAFEEEGHYMKVHL